METASLDISSLSGTDTTKTQQTIAYWALGVYGGLLFIIIVFAWLCHEKPLDDVIKMLTTVSSIVGPMVGTIIGFYFQAKSKAKKKVDKVGSVEEEAE